MVKPEQCSGFFFESGEGLGKISAILLGDSVSTGSPFFIALIEFEERCL